MAPWEGLSLFSGACPGTLLGLLVSRYCSANAPLGNESLSFQLFEELVEVCQGSC